MAMIISDAFRLGTKSLTRLAVLRVESLEVARSSSASDFLLRKFWCGLLVIEQEGRGIDQCPGEVLGGGQALVA